VVAAQTLRAALLKAEQNNPGLIYELIKGIMRKWDSANIMHNLLVITFLLSILY
jgi:hypothetical protein